VRGADRAVEGWGAAVPFLPGAHLSMHTTLTRVSGPPEQAVMRDTWRAANMGRSIQ
jgi:hypothetical protein